MDFETRAIHDGQEPDPATGSVVVPIYQTSTYAQEAVGQHKGYEYSRVANPTRTALQICLASLESAEHGVAFASGMAGTTTLMHLVHPTERVVSVNDVYGGVYRLFSQVYQPKGYDIEFLSAEEINTNLADHLDERTRIVWLETPTNPLLNVIDIKAAAEAAHAVGAMVVVDNTFASPYLQQPLLMGADLVTHSTTKYLGGHSDVVGGAVIGNSPDLHERLKFIQNAAGGVPGPFDSWLVLRGAKTLAVRMERHSANGLAIAEWLAEHPKVKSVNYPGLPTHPQHALARRQMRSFGGMLSFELRSGGEAAAKRVAARTKIFALAESLGGVESLIEIPLAMTHGSVKGTKLAPPAGLIRLSVGIEGVGDLIADLAHAIG
jgi:cystathionine beta-lyase/cystathionine gamma-synthase